MIRAIRLWAAARRLEKALAEPRSMARLARIAKESSALYRLKYGGFGNVR